MPMPLPVQPRSGPDSGDDVCQNTDLSNTSSGLSEEEEDEYEALLREFAAAGMTSKEDVDSMSPISDSVESTESHLEVLNSKTIPISSTRTEVDEPSGSRAGAGAGASAATSAGATKADTQKEKSASDAGKKANTPVPVPTTSPPAVQARCLSEVYGVKTKKPSFTHSRRRFVRDGIQEHSGDATVPYVSLSFARTWLGENVTGNRVWEERRPEYVHRGPFETWAPPLLTDLSITVDPAVDIFHSEHANGDTTVVMEVSRGDHLDIAKDPYVHFLMFDHLLTKMSEDLCLDDICQQEEAARKASRSGGDNTNLSFLGRKVSEAASSMLEYLASSVRPSVPTD
jgi:hypothetical protein